MRISDWSSDVCSSDLMRACDQSFERNILVVSFDLYDWLDMTLDQLRIFVAVAEREHVTQAARALNLTQSAVSAAIATLEDRHGAHLFDRVGRGITLPEAGRAFLPEARAGLADRTSTRLTSSHK